MWRSLTSLCNSTSTSRTNFGLFPSGVPLEEDPLEEFLRRGFLGVDRDPRVGVSSLQIGCFQMNKNEMLFRLM